MKYLTAIFLSTVSTCALGQSSPNLKQGQVPTAAQWNGYFAKKQDFSGVPPLSQSGGALSGKLTLNPSTSTSAGLNVGQGNAPSLPLNGDLWITPSGLFVRASGVTLGPILTTTASAIGSGAAKWAPLFFGNFGTGATTLMNRLFVGEATLSSFDVGPVTTKDWVETLLANTTSVSMLASVDTVGQLGILGASRSSDFRTVFGSATGGAQGVTGIGYNNDTTGSPIALGMNGIGIRPNTGVTGITLGAQSDMNNAGSVVDIEPNTGITGGTTMAQLATGGAYAGLSTTDISAAYVVGQGRPGGPTSRKGMVMINGALDATIGAGGGGLAMDLFRGQSIRWRNATPTTDSEMWGNASGLNITSALISGVNAGAGGALTLNGSSSGSRAFAVNATGSTFTFGGGALSVAEGGTGDTGTAWGTFTPTPVCGNLSLTTNRAVFKTLGKTTNLTLDVTVGGTAGTTCLATATFTLSGTAAGAAYIPGQEFSTTHEIGGCLNSTASSTSTCAKRAGANFLTNERYIFTGAFDIQ